MAQSLKTMTTLFVTNNKKYLESDGYLSFEEVKSIELNPIIERKLNAHWIDGVQLKKDGKLDVWVSTIQSEEIFPIALDKLPKSTLIPLLSKIAEAVAYKKIKIE